jgi:molybdate transport system ATP-binding protein
MSAAEKVPKDADGRLQLRADKRLGVFEFRCDVDLPLDGVTALFGASGAGKSTFIALLAGLLRPDHGRIALGSQMLFDSAAGIDVAVERRALGVVFQDARLFPHLTVQRNLLFGLRRAGPRALAPVAAPEAVIALLGLEPLLERRPHTLSGGERQRVAIGRALLAQPRALLLDEPLASLDAPRKAEVLPYIERLRDEFAVPIVYVSHAIDEVLRLARHLIVLDAGAVVAAGPVDDVLQQAPVARLFPAVEAGSLLHGVIAAHDAHYGLSVLQIDGGPALRIPKVDLPPGSRLRVRIPARDVALSLSQPVDVSTVNRLAGVIVTMQPLDPSHVDVEVEIASGVRLRARVTREACDRLALAEGREVWCLIKSVALDRATLLLTPEAAARESVSART